MSAAPRIGLFRWPSQHWVMKKRLFQGRRSRSGRSSDHQTNVLIEIASPTLCLQTRNPHIVFISMPARTSQSGRKRELRRAENEQILSVVATHPRPALHWISKNSNWLACMRRSFTSFQRDLKLPMDTYLNACRRNVNQNPATMPGIKQRLVMMFWTPK